MLKDNYYIFSNITKLCGKTYRKIHGENISFLKSPFFFFHPNKCSHLKLEQILSYRKETLDNLLSVVLTLLVVEISFIFTHTKFVIRIILATCEKFKMRFKMEKVVTDTMSAN